MGSKIASRVSVALVQLAVSSNKQQNLRHAREMIKKAAEKCSTSVTSTTTSTSSTSRGCSLVLLPECFNSPYGTQYFDEYAEEIPGQTTSMLADAAKEEGVFVVGGSIPERRDGKLYNTCTVFNPNGDMVMKYSKMHLFDIDVPGKIRFQESEVLSSGNKLGIFELFPDIKVGVGICYDVRFAELGMLMAREGCSILLYPGAFNMTTGPAHWELLQRARAVDNQVYVATCSPARDTSATYVAWGHSMVTNPWGEVICKTEESEDIITTEIGVDYLQEVRKQVPIHYQRRDDVYCLKKC